jgi:hypothetical protein
MPTYRIPVRVKINGYLVVEAADSRLALESAHDLDAYESFDSSRAEWADWGPFGEPVEVEP